MSGYSSMPVAILIDIMTKLLVASLWMEDKVRAFCSEDFTKLLRDKLA